jgi:hypothetical protein
MGHVGEQRCHRRWEVRLNSRTDRNDWFRAKRFGWGWGPPSSWQGWVVLVAYLVLVVGGIPLVQATKGDLVYVVYTMVCTVTLLVLCWLKGDPAGRRSSRDNE